MSVHQDSEVEDAAMSYPSPGAGAMEAGPFYNTAARESVPDHHDHTDHVPEQVQAQEHHHGELPPESAPPQQHVSRPANLEELQLAAQLGQGLAGTPIMPATDPNMTVEDPNLRSIMPQPEPSEQQDPSYVQDTPSTDQMVSHSMPVPVPMPPQYLDNTIPPRKRSKVSRACDECRRKKIKCDAQSDTGETPCSSCGRASIRCLFSRIPQKRGPSKGYIKELADRIHSIEHKLENEGGLSQEEIDHLFVPERSRQNNVNGDDASRKRPFSSISGEFTTPATTRQTPWGSEHRSIQPSSAASDGYAPYSTGSLAPHPSAIKADATPSKPPVATMDIPMPDTDAVPDIQEDTLHSYLSTVQPVYPILPSNKGRLQELLAQCPSPIRVAFANALPAVTMAAGDVKVASSLLNDWEGTEAPHSLAANIVHAQTLLLLIIEADWRSSSALPFLLARAVALANSMKLWRYTPMESASEPDSDDQLCVRIWWSLILMDRWHAAGTGKPAQIPDSSVVAPPGLENILGEVCFYLVRLSKLLNRVSHVISTLQPGSTTTEQPMAAILTDYIENYREDLPAHIEPASHPLVHLAYWHCKLLVSLLTPGATPAETLWPTKELTNLLFINTYLWSPLLNHFASLVAMSLTKLSKLDSSKEEATQLIKEILEKPGGVWDGIRDKLSEQVRPSSSVETAAASQGLQHLADLATAHEGITTGGDDIAFGPSLASGYLDVA
ncbi:Glucose-responsive transcription factor [Neonectria magnoliae]|uniref:Glucose-responsive transcription factor n=1 Tax=Neonectria magnoliae TaxID=2732573 RepID=A0ABR1I5R9_9HYPO